MKTRQPADAGRGGGPLQWRLLGGVVVAHMLLERRRPLGKRVENDLDHSDWLTNERHAAAFLTKVQTFISVEELRERTKANA